MSDVGLDTRLILKMDFKEIGRQEVHWIQIARDTVQRRILVNTAFNLRNYFTDFNEVLYLMFTPNFFGKIL